MGRPKKLLPADGLAKIKDLASRGFSEKDIARSLGTTAKTFSRLKSENVAVVDALDEGRSVEHQALYGKLYEKAMNGEIVALLFLLKCRHGYRETADVTAMNATQIVIQMPGAMDRDAYVKLIAPQREATNG